MSRRSTKSILSLFSVSDPYKHNRVNKSPSKAVISVPEPRHGVQGKIPKHRQYTPPSPTKTLQVDYDDCMHVVKDKETCNNIMNALKRTPELCDGYKSSDACIRRVHGMVDDTVLQNAAIQKLQNEKDALFSERERIAPKGKTIFTHTEMTQLKEIGKQLAKIEKIIEYQQPHKRGGKSNPIKSRKQKKGKRITRKRK